jgi:hypothetical protein
MHIGNRVPTTIISTASFLALGICWLVINAPAHADAPTFTIEFHDGKLTPVLIQVPANTQVRIELNNTGKTPAEFESHELHIEKVVVPNSKSSVVLRPLDPGRYGYFDDFHEDAPKGVLIAK